MIVPLHCHPDTPASQVTSVEVEITMTDPDDVLLTFIVQPADGVKLPEPAAPARTDGLWQATCFELFVAMGDHGYVEFNLAPSSQWAAYLFDGYREGMQAWDVAVAPHVEVERKSGALSVAADIDLTGTLPGPLKIALSAVIEELDGTKSYWALRHPPGRPDFHHPDCFVRQLP